MVISGSFERNMNSGEGSAAAIGGRDGEGERWIEFWCG